MATKKTTKSNKTSHVLNLLTSAPAAEEGVEQAGGSAQASAGGNVSGGAGVTLDPNMLSDFHEAAKKTKEAAEHFDGAVSNFQSAVENFDVKEEQMKEEHKKEAEKQKEEKQKEELQRALEE